jgi:hypothetical protein
MLRLPQRRPWSDSGGVQGVMLTHANVLATLTGAMKQARVSVARLVSR